MREVEKAAELRKCKLEQRISTFFKLKAISEKFQGKETIPDPIFMQAIHEQTLV